NRLKEPSRSAAGRGRPGRALTAGSCSVTSPPVVRVRKRSFSNGSNTERREGAPAPAPGATRAGVEADAIAPTADIGKEAVKLAAAPVRKTSRRVAIRELPPEGNRAQSNVVCPRRQTPFRCKFDTEILRSIWTSAGFLLFFRAVRKPSFRH